MLSYNSKIGLVLAGGGAKGAYQAGALRYLAEQGFSPDVIAGTSIGALNGAVLSSYRPFPLAVDKLNELWAQLGHAKILRPHRGTVLRTANFVAGTVVPTLDEWVMDLFTKAGLLKEADAIFDIEPIEHLMQASVHIKQLQQGIELWVATFPSLLGPVTLKDIWIDGLIDVIRSKLGTEAHWFCVQDFDNDEDVYNLLLASAAIPLAFPKREINDQYYVDGGLADNIPFGAIAKRGCTHALVIHLNNGEIWNRDDFTDQIIIEIRPRRSMQSNIPIVGFVESLLDFSLEHIEELKENGYQDAKHCIEEIGLFWNILNNHKRAESELTLSTLELLNDKSL